MSEKELEKCVMPNCGKETNIPMDTLVELRATYIEGVGQLCYGCYGEVYPSQRELATGLYQLNELGIGVGNLR